MFKKGFIDNLEEEEDVQSNPLYGKTLYLACSKSKLSVPQAKAVELYNGTLFKLGVRLAHKYHMPIVILSAKYGFIQEFEVIKNYDEKMKNYTGPYPDKKGFYIGGKDYFGNAPSHIQRLVPKSGNGLMAHNIRLLIDGHSQESLFCKPRKSKKNY